MMDCSFIIDQMTWSYSRINTFRQCKYEFFLSYIMEEERRQNFFAQYGSFMHKIIEKYLTGEIAKDELPLYYVMNFGDFVTEKAPSYNIYIGYYKAGLKYLSSEVALDDIDRGKSLDVEKEFKYNIDGLNLVGFIDVIRHNPDDTYSLIDHKTHKLMPRSGRKKPTKTDRELDRYLIQLYLYSVWTESEFGNAPKDLIFNVFRENRLVVEPFERKRQIEALDWVKSSVTEIRKENDWEPTLDFFYCNNLCNMRDHCEYTKML